MAGFTPTHRRLSDGVLVRATQWHQFGDRPEGLPDCLETNPFFRAALTPEPLVRKFCFDLTGHRPGNRERDERPHADLSADAFMRDCTTLMREHGWLPHPHAEHGTGWLLCPGDWLVLFADGDYRAESARDFYLGYQAIGTAGG